MHTLRLKTTRRTQLMDITESIAALVQTSTVRAGLCHIYVPHTTAAILINEHADPDVASDVEAALDRLIPQRGPYAHAEGNSDSHIKAILVGTSQSIFIENARLVLGRWQGIFFAEFDGPRERHVYVKIVPDPQ